MPTVELAQYVLQHLVNFIIREGHNARYDPQRTLRVDGWERPKQNTRTAGGQKNVRALQLHFVYLSQAVEIAGLSAICFV